MLHILQVKVKIWVNDAEDETLVGLTARFGALLPSQAEDDLKLPAVFMNPINGCSSSSKVMITVLATLIVKIDLLVYYPRRDYIYC